MKTLDVLVFIPLIPALPVLATWYLPWETWIPKKLPKSVIGPYLLYCAFGAWYFKMPWWVVAVVSLYGIIVCVIFVEYFLRVFLHGANLIRSRKWPIVTATVLSADCQPPGYGCIVAEISYEYIVNGDKYGDIFGRPFIPPESGKNYASQFANGMELKVRVKPNDPTKSVPLWGSRSMVFLC